MMQERDSTVTMLTQGDSLREDFRLSSAPPPPGPVRPSRHLESLGAFERATRQARSRRNRVAGDPQTKRQTVLSGVDPFEQNSARLLH